MTDRSEATDRKQFFACSCPAPCCPPAAHGAARRAARAHLRRSPGEAQAAQAHRRQDAQGGVPGSREGQVHWRVPRWLESVGRAWCRHICR
eukprot:5535059-Prymnesium_polylepis.1